LKARQGYIKDTVKIKKKAWYLHKNRHIMQKIEGVEVTPYIYSVLILQKVAKNIHSMKDSCFNRWCWDY
jgi:hypothetical protein